MLRYIYARAGGDVDKSLHYADLHRKFEEKRRYDMLAFDYYETLASYYVNKRSPNVDIHRLASLYFDELYPMLESVGTSSFYRNTYHIGIIKYDSVNETKNAIELCNEAFNALKLKPNTHRSTLVDIVTQKIALYTQLRNNEGVKINELVTYCLESIEEGYFAWFRLFEVYFYYCTYSNQFEEPVKIYGKVTKSSRFKLLEGSYHDNWLLLGGYLHLLAKLNVLDSTEVENVVGKFRYAKLFNEIEVLKKDKSMSGNF